MEAIRRQIIRRASTLSLVGGLLVLVVAIPPYFARTQDHQNAEMLMALSGPVMLANQAVDSMDDMVRQVASRTGIRRALVGLANGDMTRAAYVAFVKPRLTDAMDGSDSVLGIEQRDNLGQVILAVGQTLPPDNGYRPAGTGAITYGGPYGSGEDTSLVLSIPITGDGGRRVGVERVMFSAAPVIAAVASVRNLPVGTKTRYLQTIRYEGLVLSHLRS